MEGSGEVYEPEPRYLAVGQVARPHGVRGELRINIITSYPERLAQHTYFYLAHSDSLETVQRYTVERLRYHQKVVLLKLSGCDDRNTAEEMRGMFVLTPIEEAAPLEEGEYYNFQLIGMKVETEDGEELGRLVEIVATGANDVYIVHGPLGEVLLPAIDDVVIEADAETKRMTVRLLPGILPEGKNEPS